MMWQNCHGGTEDSGDYRKGERGKHHRSVHGEAWTGCERWHESTLRTLARGARQLVVQLALETMFWSAVYFSSFTPMTYMGASSDGAEMITFLAPPWWTTDDNSRCEREHEVDRAQ